MVVVANRGSRVMGLQRTPELKTTALKTMALRASGEKHGGGELGPASPRSKANY